MEKDKNSLARLISGERQIEERQQLIGWQVDILETEGYKDDTSYPHEPSESPQFPLQELKDAESDTVKELGSIRKKKAWYGFEAHHRAKAWVEEQMANYQRLSTGKPVERIIFEMPDKRTREGKIKADTLKALQSTISPEDDPYLYYGLDLLKEGFVPKKRVRRDEANKTPVKPEKKNKGRPADSGKKDTKPESKKAAKVTINEADKSVIVNGKHIQFRERNGRNIIFSLLLEISRHPEGLTKDEIMTIFRESGGSEKTAFALIKSQFKSKTGLDLTEDDNGAYRLSADKITYTGNEKAHQPAAKNGPLTKETESALPLDAVLPDEAYNLANYAIRKGIINDQQLKELGVFGTENENRHPVSLHDAVNYEKLFGTLVKISKILREKDPVKKAQMLEGQTGEGLMLLEKLPASGLLVLVLESLYQDAMSNNRLLDTDGSPTKRTQIYHLLKKFSGGNPESIQADFKTSPTVLAKETSADLIETRYPGINLEITQVVDRLYVMLSKDTSIQINQISHRIREITADIAEDDNAESHQHPDDIPDKFTLTSNWATPDTLIRLKNARKLIPHRGQRNVLGRVEIVLAYFIQKYNLQGKDVKKVRNLIEDEFKEYDKMAAQNRK